MLIRLSKKRVWRHWQKQQMNGTSGSLEPNILFKAGLSPMLRQVDKSFDCPSLKNLQGWGSHQLSFPSLLRIHSSVLLILLLGEKSLEPGAFVSLQYCCRGALVLPGLFGSMLAHSIARCRRYQSTWRFWCSHLLCHEIIQKAFKNKQGFVTS